jgi:hypothetical protein
MTNNTVDKLEVKQLKSGGSEIKLKDMDNYLSIRLNKEGEVDRIHIDVVGLTETPILLQR